MKKRYVKPAIFSEEFLSDEYVTACWKINCNVPSGYGYTDDNDNGKYDSGTDTLLTPSWGNSPNIVWGCGTWHKGVQGVPNDGPTANAMWCPIGEGSDYPVYYWRDGDRPTDVHFSKVSDAQWETNPNAS